MWNLFEQACKRAARVHIDARAEVVDYRRHKLPEPLDKDLATAEIKRVRAMLLEAEKELARILLRESSKVE